VPYNISSPFSPPSLPLRWSTVGTASTSTLWSRKDRSRTRRVLSSQASTGISRLVCTERHAKL